MTVREIPTSGGRSVIIRSRDCSVIFGVRNAASHVGSVCVTWDESSPERASQLVESMDKEKIQKRIQNLSFCADFVKDLDRALENANTQKAIIPANRVNGGYASRRY